MKYFLTALLLSLCNLYSQQEDTTGYYDTMLDFNNTGEAFFSIENYDSALVCFEQALELGKKSNDENLLPQLYYNVGETYYSLHNFDNALSNYSHALQLSKKLHIDQITTELLSNIGSVYFIRGFYNEALKYFMESLTVDNKNQDESAMAIDYNNIGMVYTSLGKYDKAIENYEKALAINRKFNDEDKVGIRLNNIGGVYQFWGKYDKALEFYKQALSIAEKLNDHKKIAIRLGNIGIVYNFQNQLDTAIDYYKRSLKINERLKQLPDISVQLNNIGSAYAAKKEYGKAIDFLEKSLDIALDLGQMDDVSIRLSNIGDVYFALGEYDLALSYYQKALSIADTLKAMEKIARFTKNIGILNFNNGHYDTAIENFKKTITILEEIRKTASGITRADYLASQIDSYQYLTTCYKRNNQNSLAFIASEQSRARYMIDQLNEEKNSVEFTIADIASFKENMSPNCILLSYSNFNANNSIQKFVMNKDSIYMFDQTEDELSNFIDSTDLSQLKFRTKSRFPELAKSSNNYSLIIMYYHYLLTKNDISLDEYKLFTELGKILYRFLLKDIEELLKNKDELIIIPGGHLSLIPFETLIMPDGKYLVEKYHIKYIQSLTVSELISERKYNNKRKPLLAFGGACYDSLTYDITMVESEQHLKNVRGTILSSLEKNEKLNESYASLGYGTISNLPATFAEVKSLEKIYENSNVVTGKNVDETVIKEMSIKGELKNYKVIHFATHGITVPEIPELSAIVLSQTKSNVNEDGFLRMQEIADLELNADFVNLSACETGLGKIYNGEGVVGLTQAFLIAGANGVSVSLWKVEDKSTMEFMTGMYKLAKEKSLSFDKALTEMKREFIKSGRYSLPFYWAGFVYWGK